MRRVLALLPLLALAGCFTEVHGDPPREACGTGNLPAQSVIIGTEASWAGRTFTALEDEAKLWIDGGEADLPDDAWWGHNAKAWAVVAARPGPQPEVVEARAGLVQYGTSQTTVRVGGAGQSVANDPQMVASYQLIGPIVLARDETLLVVGAADARLSTLGLHLRWEGCGRTGDIVWGVGEGVVAGWGDLSGPLVLENAAAGSIAYKATLERSMTSGVVLAQSPPGGDAGGQNEAKLTTSRGSTELHELAFFVHDGGTVKYETTHVGEAGREPLLAFLPLEFRVA